MRTSIPEARIAMHLGTRGIEKIEARFGPENQVIASHILSLNLVSPAPCKRMRSLFNPRIRCAKPPPCESRAMEQSLCGGFLPIDALTPPAPHQGS